MSADSETWRPEETQNRNDHRSRSEGELFEFTINSSLTDSNPDVAQNAFRSHNVGMHDFSIG